jgi:hypothetical protein
MIRKILKFSELITEVTDKEFKETKLYCSQNPNASGCFDDDPLGTPHFKLEFEKVKKGMCLKIYKQEYDLNKYYYGNFLSEDEGDIVSEKIGTILLTNDNIKELKEFLGD